MSCSNENNKPVVFLGVTTLSILHSSALVEVRLCHEKKLFASITATKEPVVDVGLKHPAFKAPQNNVNKILLLCPKLRTSM